MKKIKTSLLFLAFLVALTSTPSFSEEQKARLITESYYRVKWGYFDQFMDLFKRNHYPILKEMKKRGLVDAIVIDYPVNHASEQARWDVRVTVSITDTAAFKREMGSVSKQLYPDQAQLKKAETQRLRLLLAHQDIMIRREKLSNW